MRGEDGERGTPLMSAQRHGARDEPVDVVQPVAQDRDEDRQRDEAHRRDAQDVDQPAVVRAEIRRPGQREEEGRQAEARPTATSPGRARSRWTAIADEDGQRRHAQRHDQRRAAEAAGQLADPRRERQRERVVRQPRFDVGLTTLRAVAEGDGQRRPLGRASASAAIGQPAVGEEDGRGRERQEEGRDRGALADDRGQAADRVGLAVASVAQDAATP